MTYQPSTM